MKIRNYKNLEIAETPHGINVYKLYDTDHALIMHLHLKAGESLKPHITPVDVAFYILEGTPTILVGEEKIDVTKDEGELIATCQALVYRKKDPLPGLEKRGNDPQGGQRVI